MTAKSLAVITGASSGIGLEFARRLAATHDLLLIARRGDRLAALATELAGRHGAAVDLLVADLTENADLQLVTDRISAAPNLDLLINNAGFGSRGAFWESDLDTLERMHRLQVMAVVRLTHAALRVLVRNDRGAIVNVASVASFAQRAGSGAYGATKSWLAALSEGIQLDLWRANSAVKVQALCPGFTYSGFHDLLGEDRHAMAPARWWLSAEAVVDASLGALAGGPLFVVPGWRYRLILAVLTKTPLWLKLRLEAFGARPGR